MLALLGKFSVNVNLCHFSFTSIPLGGRLTFGIVILGFVSSESIPKGVMQVQITYLEKELRKFQESYGRQDCQ